MQRCELTWSPHPIPGPLSLTDRGALLNCCKKTADVTYDMDLTELFIQHPDGSYEPKQKVTLKGSEGEVTLWPGRKLPPDLQVLGVCLRELFGDRIDPSQSNEPQSDFFQKQA
jgi:hypothetical protein